MVYNSERLAWSAKHDLVPVAAQVASIGGLDGLVVTLDERGTLAVSYMGTDPPTQVVATQGEEVLNFEEMESEHRQLLNVIRQHATEKPPEPVEQLMLRAQIPQYMKTLGGGGQGIGGGGYGGQGVGGYDNGYDDEDDFAEDEDLRPTRAVVGRIFLNYSGMSEIRDISISVQVPEPVRAEPQQSLIASIQGSAAGRQTPMVVELKLFPGSACLPSDRTMNVSASYVTESGESRISHCEVQLPLCLFGSLVSPVKSAAFKITLDTNRDAPQLVSVFEDIFAASQENYMEMNANVNVMSFKYVHFFLPHLSLPPSPSFDERR